MLKILCDISVFILMATIHIVALLALIFYLFVSVKYFKDMFMLQRICTIAFCLIIFACNVILVAYSANLIHR